MKKKQTKSQKKNISRTPIVTVLGHVDHGKTTLLDAIRDSREQQKEAGGITQSIAASKIILKDAKAITFIDTPGHSAFTKMRSRGAKIADIAVLVVAANDGVKPQTEEALKFIQETSTPFIVAITKIDLPSISVEKVRGQLTKLGVKLEGEGGDTPVISVSAKSGKGVEELLETITLLSEVSEVSDNPNEGLTGYIIETNVDKSGPVVSMVIKNGKLAVGDEIYSGGSSVKVRAIFDTNSKSVKESKAGEAVNVLGFKDLPSVGAIVSGSAELTQKSTKESRQVQDDDANLSIVLKANSNGSLEAIKANIPAGVSVVGASVGELNDSDVFLAKSTDSKLIFVFEAKVPNSVSRLAKTEGVSIETFEIIYKLFERLEEMIASDEEIILGEAKILTTFPFNKRKVAGSKVTKGRIDRSDTLVLMRDDDILGKVKIQSMKKLKADIQNAKEGEELGIIFTPQLDFEPGDVLISVKS